MTFLSGPASTARLKPLSSKAWGIATTSLPLLLCVLSLIPQAARAQDTTIPSSSAAPHVLPLAQAIEKAIAASPKLEAAASGIAAAAGTEQQAKLYPNPQGSLLAENFGGAGPYRGFTATETSASVSQLFELGGKREARQSAAFAGRKTAEVDAVTARLDLARDVTVAYSEAAVAKDGVDVAKEMELAAKQVLDDVSRRVKAARDPLFQRNKAEVAYSTSLVARQIAEQALTATLQRLGRFWGAQTVEDTLVDQSIAPLDRPQPLDAYETRLRASPDLERFQRLREVRAAELRLAEANAVPDITASAGVRQTPGIGGVTFLAGVSVPIPIFNQNQGEIARAQAELRRVEQDRRQAEIERSQELVSAWTNWQSAWQEAASIKTLSLPQAETAYRQALAGYRSGAFEYLEVLDAQRTFFEQRSNYITALARLSSARAQTERLAPSAEPSQPATGAVQ